MTTTASSSGKFEAVLWHLVYEEEIGSVKGHFGPVNALAWLPDGTGFITGARHMAGSILWRTRKIPNRSGCVAD